MQGEAALNDWEASKTLQAVASSVLDERVWAKVEICRTVWQRGFSDSYGGTVPRRAGEGARRLSVFWATEASLRLGLGKARAEPWFSGLQARRVWGDPDLSSEGRRGRRWRPPCWFRPVGWERARLSLVGSDRSLQQWLAAWGFCFSPAHTRLAVHRMLACEIAYFWNGLPKSVGGLNYISSPAAATVLQLWPLRAIPLLSTLNCSPWAVPEASRPERDARN